MTDALDEGVHQNVTLLCAEGDALAGQGDYDGALLRGQG